MQIHTKEHYEVISEFEKNFKGERFDKESKDLWPKGIVYQDGYVNKMFLAFRLGVSLGKVI